MDSLLAAFEGIEDPRVERTKSYPLTDVMFLVLCAVLCGVESWRGVEDFGEDRLDWLRKYLPFENGIPSHQTVGRIISLLKGDCVTKAFVQFMASIFSCHEDEIIALDGKTLRRSFDKASGQKPLHILNAWAINAGVSLGQVKVDQKTNEITAVPELLDMLDIRHATIVADAMNTQKAIAKKIIVSEADYALPVKGNHKQLEEDIEHEFDTQPVNEKDKNIFLETVEKAHGRIEIRRYSILSAAFLDQRKDWAGLKNIGKVLNETFHDGKKSTEIRYFLLSFDGVERFAQTVRGHWGIENRLHWVLDVTFGEDDCRVRKDHAPENFSTIRKLALNFLRKETSTKLSIPRKQARAARKPEYLDLLLKGKMN